MVVLKDVLIVAALLAAVGCAPTVYFSKEYQNSDFAGHRLMVSIIDSITISYEGDMDNEFPAQNRYAAIKDFLAKAVVKAAQDSSVFSSVEHAELVCDSMQRAQLGWKGKDTFTVYIPAGECNVPADASVRRSSGIFLDGFLRVPVVPFLQEALSMARVPTSSMHVGKAGG